MEILRTSTQQGLEITLPPPHRGQITNNTSNAQAWWGSRPHFLKEACLLHGAFGVVEKFMKCACT